MNIREILKEELIKELKPMKMMTETYVTENLKYHLDNNLSLGESVFRTGSKSHLDLINEVRELHNVGFIQLNEDDKSMINSDLGKTVMVNGKEVYLDLPIEIESLNEAEYQGRKVQVGKPMRNSGGGKKYVVYVKNPSTGKIKKISFGDVSGGLTAKVSNPKARKAFASRHQCDKKKDRMTAGYWACRINRYGHLWGGKTYPGYW
jgi:hypothetical protein